jgi:ribosomal-protein-alanine N-acetyltransferase
VSAHWPVTLEIGNVRLRPLKPRDAKRWQQLRLQNQEWLTPWEATSPLPALENPPTFAKLARRLNHDAKSGRALPFVVEYRGAFVGQLNVSDIVYGSLRATHIGYWIDQGVAGRGIMTAAVARVSDYLFDELKLHRIEIAIRPENEPSNRLVRSLGFVFEGVRPNFLHINHEWCDHNIYRLTSEERNGLLVDRLTKLP